ncbi:MAG: YggS family pyridoxal phosphate-dependent enzyme [bacterium]|nr:YggS family pyridoxal phosphate-dependent enzyme [bacterium]
MTERLLSDREKRFLENYSVIKEKIAESAACIGKSEHDIILLAATKTVDAKLINFAISQGINYIGENRVQEFLGKKDNINTEAKRHFIGHLQTNKVKDIVGEVCMIQSVDSFKLATEIGKQCVKRSKIMDILLEVNIGNEKSKSGFQAEQVSDAVAQISKVEGVKVRGLMAIPPICEKEIEIVRYFDKMHNLFIDIKAKKMDNSSMDYLSMGMSGDYDVAIRHGANLVRVGTSLFGTRNYK